MIVVLALAALAAGGLVGRLERSVPALVVSAATLVAALAGTPALHPPIAVAPGVVLLLGAATLLARPPAWRSPQEVGSALSTTLVVALAFSSSDLVEVAVLWGLSLVPGLLHREDPGVSRRPVVLVAVLGGAAVVAALAWLDGTAAYVALVLGGALRMGVPPFSPLVMGRYERLPLGRTALVAAGRPSVALLLAARAALPADIAYAAVWLQPWAAIAALLAGLQGLSATTPRRSLGAMAATQSAILLYGLVSPGELGLLGALVQWAGLGLSLLGIGLIVEAMECRLGHRRAARVRGLLGPAPGMALLFLLFAATMSGFPGTAGFVGEDLILQASGHSVWRAMLVVATALNGMTMLRLFARSFLGALTPCEARGFPPLTARERSVLGVMAVAVGVLTAWPGVVH